MSILVQPTTDLLSHSTPHGRIPTLDGWRGLAILLVLFDHAQNALQGRYLRPWTQTGQHGVTIFFVLSGFLITSKLLESSSLKRFYMHRLFRLMPAAWTYLAVLLFTDRVEHLQFTSLSEVTASVLFYRNFYFGTGGAGHFWSLSLEEQFYLVWPCVLLLAGIRRCRWIAVVGALSVALYRWLFWARYNANLVNGQTHVRADALLVGCLLALLLASPAIRSAATRWSKFWMLPALATLLFCMAHFHWLPPLSESLAIAGLMAASVLHPDSILSRPLNRVALAWLGTVSYSIYIWQQPFSGHRSTGSALLLLGVAMPVCALGSYYYIEQPMIRLGRSLTRSRTSHSDRLARPLEPSTTPT
jgi:peptidoglycan/LPS O-acetylase OafA/YrhL